MAKIKADLINKPISEKISFGRVIITSLTGNTLVLVSTSRLSSYTNSVNGLDNANNNVSTAQRDLEEMYARQFEAEKEYDRQTGFIVNEINGITDVEAKLATTGFAYSKNKGRTGTFTAIVQPQNLRATLGKKQGEVDVHWNSVKTAHGYELQYSPDSSFPDNKVTRKSLGKKSKVTLSGLESGTRIWIRVAAIKGEDTGPWSDPAISMIS